MPNVKENKTYDFVELYDLAACLVYLCDVLVL